MYLYKSLNSIPFSIFCCLYIPYLCLNVSSTHFGIIPFPCSLYFQFLSLCLISLFASARVECSLAPVLFLYSLLLSLLALNGLYPPALFTISTSPEWYLYSLLYYLSLPSLALFTISTSPEWSVSHAFLLLTYPGSFLSSSFFSDLDFPSDFSFFSDFFSLLDSFTV